MARIKPPADRSTVTDNLDSVLVSIPVRKHWFLILFLPVWLIGWAFGEVTVATQLFNSGSSGPPELFLIAWLSFWTIGGIFCAVVLLWTLFGIESTKIDGRSIRVRRGVLGVGLTREYDLIYAKNMRVAPESFNMFDMRHSMRFWGFGGGLIAFDYGSSTIRFGGGIEEAEAARVVSAITDRFSSLRAKPRGA